MALRGLCRIRFSLLPQAVSEARSDAFFARKSSDVPYLPERAPVDGRVLRIILLKRGFYFFYFEASLYLISGKQYTSYAIPLCIWVGTGVYMLIYYIHKKSINIFISRRNQRNEIG